VTGMLYEQHENVRNGNEILTEKPPEFGSSAAAESVHGIGPLEIRGQGDSFSFDAQPWR